MERNIIKVLTHEERITLECLIGDYFIDTLIKLNYATESDLIITDSDGNDCFTELGQSLFDEIADSVSSCIEVDPLLNKSDNKES